MKSLVMTCRFTTGEEMVYNEHLGTIKNHISSLTKLLYNSVTEKEPLCATWQQRVGNTILKCSEGHGRVHHTVTCHTWFPRMFLSPLPLKWSVSLEKNWFTLRNWISVLELPLQTKQYCFASARVMIWFFETSNVQIEILKNQFLIIFSGFSVPPFEHLLVQLNTKVNMVSRIF